VRTGPILPRVLALTFFASIGAAVTWQGIFYVAKALFKYTATQNLIVGAALGFVYALAAFYAASITDAVRAASARLTGARLSTRGIMVTILALSAVISIVPKAIPTQVGLWTFGLVSVPLLGLFWPTVETYVSSGQRGRSLNRAAGLWNMCWAFALLPGMWVMAPLLTWHPTWVIPTLAPMMLIAMAIALTFPKEPGSHGEASHEHTPAQDALYRRLLRVFRICLVISYLASSSLGPVVPQLMASLDVPMVWRTPLQSVWMLSRLLTFILLGVWHGWHGKARYAPISVALFVVGFTLAITATASFGSVAQLTVGLVMMGIGLGVTYAAAIFYALEVGTTDVDAGARHEASIGLGYTLGPLLLLSAIELGLLTIG